MYGHSSFGYALKTVSEISAKSCTDTRGMICIPPAEISCTNSCMSKDALLKFCLQCKVKDDQIIKPGQTLAKKPTDNCSKMKCLHDTSLHRKILNWKKDMLLDTCSNPLPIQPNYYPVYSDESKAISFFEDTRCTGIPECPRKLYNSSELKMDYRLFINRTLALEKDCNGHVISSGRMLDDVSKNMLLFHSVLCFLCYMFIS